MTTPFNEALHAFMGEQGASYSRVPEFWEDDGDAENGPHLSGFEEHDVYLLDGVSYVVFPNGTVDRHQAYVG